MLSTGSDPSARAAAGGTTDDTLRVGARVWLLREGRSGRVVACSQGGLVCRVRLEDQAATALCLGSDLLRLHDDPPT